MLRDEGVGSILSGVGAKRSDPTRRHRASSQEVPIGIQVEFFIPVHDNGGLAFDAAHDAVFTDHLVNLFGGFTVLPGVGSGGWKDDDGTMYREPIRIMMVSVGALIADGSNVHIAALFAKAHYRQEAIFLRYLGVTEMF